MHLLPFKGMTIVSGIVHCEQVGSLARECLHCGCPPLFVLRKLAVPLERKFGVDIDDIFGPDKLETAEDVEDLISTQRFVAQRVPGFRFHLGFNCDRYDPLRPDDTLSDSFAGRRQDHQRPQSKNDDTPRFSWPQREFFCRL